MALHLAAHGQRAEGLRPRVPTRVRERARRWAPHVRIAAAARDHGGNDAVAAAYTAFGEHLHTSGRAPEIREGDYRLIDGAVAAAGLPASLVAAGEDEGYDVVLREETELALAPTGKDVGTPIITFSPGGEDEVSFFGPVIARIREARRRRGVGRVRALARTPGFAEIKRSARDRPAFG